MTRMFKSLTANPFARALHLPLVALLTFTALATPACKKKAPEVTTATASYAAGDKVDVNWKGSWWKGEVVAVKGDKFRIHYVGWSATWDEDVGADRLRAPTATAQAGTEATPAPSASVETTAASATAEPAASAAPTATVAAAKKAAYKAGDRVDINWKGSWHQGRVVSLVGTQFRVHYLGWGANWDENVGADRLRPPTASAKRGSNPKD